MSNSSDPKVVRVDIPKKGAQGSCYHAPGAPCGSHLTETYQIIAADLSDVWDLTPCENCVKHHGLTRYQNEVVNA